MMKSDDILKIPGDMDIPELSVLEENGKIRVIFHDSATSWLSLDDRFINRIQFENLNPCFLEKHIKKEIDIKNVLDEVANMLGAERYSKSISMLDEVLYYDPEYGEALFFKSKALFGQGHFVKSLRHYKRAIKADGSLKDLEYHRMLLKKASQERDNFPKIKRNIYAGDEYFSKGDFRNSLESYDRALANPTSFKTKILSKLLNKKATALVKMDRISEAVEVFKESVSVKPNDYAYFYLGIYFDIDCLKMALKITKRQLLLKACRLHEAEENALALECLNIFLDNHFKVDDDYRYALNLKLEVLKSLNADFGEVESLIDSL
ncbi:MAG: hypothetical protein IJ287_08570 [Methanobrevibacter sp.]|nr:hypothetical protein [Methanobrevibacter sp.]